MPVPEPVTDHAAHATLATPRVTTEASMTTAPRLDSLITVDPPDGCGAGRWALGESAGAAERSPKSLFGLNRTNLEMVMVAPLSAG
ncbi:hypothetical protein GCM10009779_54940 [Polymorphospora rubra]|uniref:Uncharacterized protein n=1 Tax=Polymorphospora rubra TaxID=338584 RepID=A0A810MZ80_9ACTN|nr:hypothetical protein Prubr_34870 [Polymorphospora rubra]